MGYVNPIGAVLNGLALNGRSHTRDQSPLALSRHFFIEGSLPEDAPAENKKIQNTKYNISSRFVYLSVHNGGKESTHLVHRWRYIVSQYFLDEVNSTNLETLSTIVFLQLELHSF